MSTPNGTVVPDLSSMVPAWMNHWFEEYSFSPFLLHSQNYLPPLLVAIVLGLIIGIGRRWRHKAAGVRTNMVVAASACLVTMVGIVVFDATKIGDPSRLPGQIIAGITFLGAGVIWKNGWKTQGITTAALILFSTVIGILSGFGYLLWAISATFIVVVVLQASYLFFPSDDTSERVLRLLCPLAKFKEVMLLFPPSATIDQFARKAGDLVEVRIDVRLSRQELDSLIAGFIHNSDVLAIELLYEPGS